MELLYALLLGLTLSFAAGPIFFIIIETSISHGKRAAWSLQFGAISADIIFIVIAWYGSQAFLKNLQDNIWLGLLSGAAIAGFGAYYLFKSKHTGQLQQELRLPRKRTLFVKGFMLNFLNVGVLFFWLATTITFSNLLDNEPMRMRLFYFLTLGSYLIIDSFKIYFANRFKQQLAGRRLQMIEKIIGLLLILFGIFIALRQIFGWYS